MPDSQTPLAKLYGYCNAVMEPWDGPAAIAAFAGNWVLGGTDRNGLRPLRYTLTTDGLLIAGSETGMVVVPETRIAENGRLGPGEMIAVDLTAGKLLRDDELKAEMSGRADWDKWLRRSRQLDSLLAGANGSKKALIDPEMRRRRQLLAGWSNGRYGADPAADGRDW